MTPAVAPMQPAIHAVPAEGGEPAPPLVRPERRRPSTSQNVLQFNGEWGFAVNWASLLTDIGVRWYPNLPEMMSIATKVDWGSGDLFPQFGMPVLGEPP